MSPAEIDAILCSDMSAIESRLYLYLRRHMDYATGTVGARRKISYQSIREHIEYTPPRGSKEPAYKPSKQQINRLLRKLESAGVIERLHNGKPNEYMVFRLVLATTDLNRPKEERHMSDTRAATQGATRKNPVNTGVRPLNSDTMSDKGATPEERHTSDTSDYKDLSLTRASQNCPFQKGTELSLTDAFKKITTLTGLNITDEQLSGVFDTFRFHSKHRNTQRSMPDWLAEWRVWCGREKSYGKPNPKRHPFAGGNQRSENTTARLLRESKEAAAELARAGYYDAHNEPSDDSQF